MNDFSSRPDFLSDSLRLPFGDEEARPISPITAPLIKPSKQPALPSPSPGLSQISAAPPEPTRRAYLSRQCALSSSTISQEYQRQAQLTDTVTPDSVAPTPMPRCMPIPPKASLTASVSNLENKPSELLETEEQRTDRVLSQELVEHRSAASDKRMPNGMHASTKQITLSGAQTSGYCDLYPRLSVSQDELHLPIPAHRDDQYSLETGTPEDFQTVLKKAKQLPFENLPDDVSLKKKSDAAVVDGYDERHTSVKKE
ncbi:unnamed protein product [Gongylonema pulchrum]|uniref:Uncharacterized protein n=1 Tax=Gongylonema pulchrum TaxID=637853 RepID=A0A183ESF5_9BILA|nr:unnamed protein product [Gongylonema pulchrum]